VKPRIPASERTSQKLNELLTRAVADGDARAELLKLPSARSSRKLWGQKWARRWAGATRRTAPGPGAAIAMGIGAGGLRTAAQVIDVEHAAMPRGTHRLSGSC
jgi:hypothetical protein